MTSIAFAHSLDFVRVHDHDPHTVIPTGLIHSSLIAMASGLRGRYAVGRGSYLFQLGELVMSEDLANHLEAVQAELASGEPLGDSEREKLEQLLAQISAVLEQFPTSTSLPDSSQPAVAPGVTTESDTDLSLSEQLLQVTERFEESHPNLTLAVGQVASALSGIGI